LDHRQQYALPAFFASVTAPASHSKIFIMSTTGTPAFAPQLLINNGENDISFYMNAFGAREHFCLRNEDGSIHVAELSLNGAVFHIHEVTGKYSFSPEAHEGITAIIGLFVDDVDAWMKRAVEAGAIEIKAARDYEYGYRQGTLADPFGHHWLIQKRNYTADLS
jgi:PhnB protein